MSVLFEPLVNKDLKYEQEQWQSRDLNYLGPMPYSANWSSMGCFKTSTGLWLLERKQVKNALIITSKVGKGAYFSDFYRCLPEKWKLYNIGIHEAALKINGFEEKIDLDLLLATIKRRHHSYPIVLLAHYDMFTNRANKTKDAKGKGILDKLKAIEWDMIICDEAHRLKNRKTQWTINIKKLKAKNKHIMTGTGFVNNPAEMWSLLHFLNKKEWPGYWEFRTHFCDEFLDPRGFRQILGIKPYRVDEFRTLRKRVGPRRTMEEVHAHIATPIEIVHEVDLSREQKRMYTEIKNYLQTLDEAGETLQSPNVLSQLNRLRQISVATPKVLGRDWNAVQNRMVYDIELTEPSSKLDDVMDILQEINGAQAVVFSNFKDPLSLLKVRLDKAGISYIHMEQRHSENERYRLWHDLFPKGEHKVFLSTLDLGGESINLSCAKYVVMLDRSWSPAKMNQAIGRVHRPGQKGTVEVIYINARNTVDSYVKLKLDKKHGWFKEIFG
jgi:SNF2 family DNA or RNA helicase